MARAKTQKSSRNSVRSTASARALPDWSLEQCLWQQGFTPVAGIDEAGRGALAGPVMAACVILPPGPWPFVDSKTIGPAARERLAALVRAEALAWAVGEASPAEVDQLNVLEATRLASRRALAAMQLRPAALTTDYLHIGAGLPELAVAHGDARSFQIAAASLLAKTERDRRMRLLAEQFPAYGFAQHKGYGVGRHLAALRTHGPCEAHRFSFAPVARALAGGDAYNESPRTGGSP